MAYKSQIVDLNIYLAKSEVNTSSDIIKNPSALKSVEISINRLSHCTLYIKKSYSNPPRWSKFFAHNVSARQFGQNSSTGAVLYVKVGKAVFILTFGHGHHLIDSAKIEMNFGLKSALNLLDVSSIRSIDKSSFEQHPTQTREQTGVATELQYFGLNIERDLLRAVTGKPNDKKYGKRISGMDALKLSVEIELDELPNLLDLILEAYKGELYKKGPFAWVDHIGEVKDKALHDILDDKILSRINCGNFEHIWLSVPEIIDWDRVVGFKYSNAASSPRYHDIRMSEFLQTFKETTLVADHLTQRRIFCVDSDEAMVYERPAYRFIYAEVIYQTDVYILNNGKWYRVNRKFAEHVNKFFENILLYEKSLPIYDDVTEGNYNERVAKADPASFALLDKKNILVPGAASPVEPCDLFRKGNEFIHVKRYGGSSVLSHLFNQGLVSGELFQMVPEFRKLLNSKLPETFRISNPLQKPNSNEYSVVFAIISESNEGILSIPFFSKISLRNVINRLQAIGFVVKLAKIGVDEIRKKTKEYAPQKRKI